MPFGPKKPNHDVNSRLGMPLSAAVGTSGASALRFAAVIASALTLPSRAGGSSVMMESISELDVAADHVDQRRRRCRDRA